MVATRSWPRVIVFSLLAVVLWSLTAVFLWAGLGNTWYGWVSQDWPVAEGRVLSARVEEMRSTPDDSDRAANEGPPRTIIRYRPIVEYQWQVGSGLFERDRRNFSAAVAYEETREAAEAIIAPYEVGQRVAVYYDPDQPSRGILEPGAHWGGLGVSTIVAAILAVFAAVFSVLAYRRLRG